MAARLIENGLVTYTAPVSGERTLRPCRIWYAHNTYWAVVTDRTTYPGRSPTLSMGAIRTRLTRRFPEHPIRLFEDMAAHAYTEYLGACTCKCGYPTETRPVTRAALLAVLGDTLRTTAPVSDQEVQTAYQVEQWRQDLENTRQEHLEPHPPEAHRGNHHTLLNQPPPPSPGQTLFEIVTSPPARQTADDLLAALDQKLTPTSPPPEQTLPDILRAPLVHEPEDDLLAVFDQHWPDTP